MNTLTQKPKTLHARIVSGSVVLISGSSLTTAINLAYNVAVAQFLGPKGFGHATVVYTLLTLLSAVTLAFQLVSSKVVAQQTSAEGKAAVYRVFHRTAWVCGILVALLLLQFQSAIASYLNLPSSDLIAILAIGTAFYVPLGTRRGYLQGTCGFRRLAVNMVLEGAVRLGGSLLLILAGYGVRGVIAANAAAIAIAYFAASSKLAARIPNPLERSYAVREILQAMVFFSGQVLINNSDIVLVKHFFPAQTAGLYAAIAMVGRVIYSFSSAVVNTTFPLVAGTGSEERKDLRVIATSLMLVTTVGTAITIALWTAPAELWRLLFGSGFEISGKYDVSYLLALYALTTVVFSLSTVIITFEMSYKIANTSWVQLVFGIVIIASICQFHSSLRQVILVQLVLLAALVICVALPFLIDSLTDPKDRREAGVFRPIRLIRLVSEDEVIAEFLKNDFHSSVYRDYHESLREIVSKPDLEDAEQNTTRRALLFVKHLSLWKELPQNTKWYEVEVDPAELGGIRIFPRAQWRRIAAGNFSLPRVAQRLDARRHQLDAQFLAKIDSIGGTLSDENHELGSVILIGTAEDQPLTVLDGNHRLVSAMLAAPEKLGRLRFLCGLSPRMTECCWYNTNLVTLFRYGVNVLTQTIRTPETELARVLRNPDPQNAVPEAP